MGLSEGVSHMSAKSLFSKALGLAAPWVSLTGVVSPGEGHLVSPGYGRLVSPPKIS